MKWVLTLFLFSSVHSFAQTLDSFKYLGDQFSGYGYLGVAFSHGEVRNNAMIRPDKHHLSGNFMELNYKHQNLEQGRWQYDLHAKMYTDIIKQLADLIGGKKSAYTQPENTGLTSGPTGWHTLGFNLLGGDRVTITPAIHHNDYFFFANARDSSAVLADNPSLTTREPQGYYFAAGPSFMLSILPSKYLLINIKAQYSIPYWKPINVSGAVVDEEYPFPRFFGLTTEFVSPWGIYLEIDHNRLINRGDNPNNAMRTDFNIGFKFVKDQ